MVKVTLLMKTDADTRVSMSKGKKKDKECISGLMGAITLVIGRMASSMEKVNSLRTQVKRKLVNGKTVKDSTGWKNDINQQVNYL